MEMLKTYYIFNHFYYKYDETFSNVVVSMYKAYD